MNLFEEVTALSKRNLDQSKYEYDKISQRIKSAAFGGDREVFILGGITERVKKELIDQGFSIKFHSGDGQRFGHFIRW